MASKKRDRDENEPGADWKRKLIPLNIEKKDWARASQAADAIVKRARRFTAPSDDAIFAQHVKAQLAYLNMCRTVSLEHVGDLGINAGVSGDMDVNLSNKKDKAFTTVVDGSVTLEGSLEVDLGTQGHPLDVMLYKAASS